MVAQIAEKPVRKTITVPDFVHMEVKEIALAEGNMRIWKLIEMWARQHRMKIETWFGYVFNWF